MKIIRNGKEFELTAEELRKANEEYELECMVEDVKSMCKQENYEAYNEEQLQEIAKLVSRNLSRNDSYYEVYWETVRYTLKDYNN